MEHWYQVTVYKAHMGHKKAGENDATAYIYAENPVKVLGRYNQMPNVKHFPTRNNFPNIFPLPQSEPQKLEKRIIDEKRISLNRAKRTWYYSEFI